MASHQTVRRAEDGPSPTPLPPYLEVRAMYASIPHKEIIKSRSRRFSFFKGRLDPTVSIQLCRPGIGQIAGITQTASLGNSPELSNVYCLSRSSQLLHFQGVSIDEDILIFTLYDSAGKYSEYLGKAEIPVKHAVQMPERLSEAFPYDYSGTEIPLTLDHRYAQGIPASLFVRFRWIPGSPEYSQTTSRSSTSDSPRIQTHTKRPHATITPLSFQMPGTSSNSQPFAASLKPDSQSSCSRCWRYSNEEEPLFEHMRKHHPTFSCWTYMDRSGVTYSGRQCPMCQSIFQTTPDFWWHLKQTHSIDWIYTDRQLSNDLARCPNCPNAFQSTMNLAWHMKQTHGIELRLRCLLCGDDFSDEQKLVRHVKENHHEIQNVQQLTNASLTFRKCSACDKVFPSEERVREHEVERHNIESPELPSRGTPEQLWSARLSQSSLGSVGESSISADHISNRSLVSVPEEIRSQVPLTTNSNIAPSGLLDFQPIRRDSHFTDTPNRIEERGFDLQIEPNNSLGITYLPKDRRDGSCSSSYEFENVSIIKATGSGSASATAKKSNTAILTSDASPETAARDWSADAPSSSNVAATGQEPVRDANDSDIAAISEQLAQAQLLESPVSVDECLMEATPIEEIRPEPVPERIQTSLFDPSKNSQDGLTHILSNRLSSFFSPTRGSNRGFSDAEIQEISGLLSDIDENWSKIPRTYILLRTIGHLPVIEKLRALGFNDYWFPVTPQQLPQRLLDPEIRDGIVENQHLILTKSTDLIQGENGRHRHFDRTDVLHFQEREILGTGTFGRVDKVLSLINYENYARKRVHRRDAFVTQSASSIRDFIGEVERLKRMQHNHVVKLTGSYTDPTYFAIIMSPVAEMDLSKYLETCGEADHGTLRTYFGCLATALKYLHSENIRHKDIKPQNILISKRKILFTDFGLSRDTTGADSATSGFTGYTPRYCAPEVFNYEPRSYPSDIWSLGCVFLEMLIVLKGNRIAWMNDFYANHGNPPFFVRTNPEATQELLAAVQGYGIHADDRALEWIKQMIQTDAQKRLSAARLVTLITEADRQGLVSPWCGTCCTHKDEPSEGTDELNDEMFEKNGHLQSHVSAE